MHLAAHGMELDLGGYVKECAAYWAVCKLLDYGLESALVGLAGDIAVTGPQPDGKPWRIGIRNPAGLICLYSVNLL